MKKILSLNLVLMTVFSCIALFFYERTQDSNRWENLGMQEQSFFVNLENTTTEKEELLQGFKQLADSYDILIVKTEINYSKDEKVISKYLMATNNQYATILDHVNLTKGEFLDFKKNPAAYMTTNEKDSSATGHLLDFAGDDVIYIKSLQVAPSLKGTYYITPLETDFDTKEFYTKLESLTGLPYDELSRKTFYSGNSTPLLFTILIFVVLIQILLCILFFLFIGMQSLRKIAVLKLNGWNQLDIWFDSIKNYLFILLITSVVTNLFLNVILKNLTVSFQTHLLLLELLFALILILTSLSVLIIAHFTPLSLLLKNRIHQKIALIPVLIVKLFFVTAVICFAYLIPTNFSSLQAEKEKIVHWESFSDYYVLSSMSLGEDFNGIVQGTSTDMAEDLTNYYKELNTLGAIYIHSEEITPNQRLQAYQNVMYYDPAIGNQISSFFSMTVNPNYLKNFPVYDEQGNQISVSENEQSRLLFIPKSKADQAALYAKLYQSLTLDSKLSFERRYHLEEEALDSSKIQIIYLIYDDSEPFFSFNDGLANSANGTVNSPIFNVLTIANGTPDETSNILNTGIYTTLKLPFAGTEDELENILVPIQKKVNLIDNRFEYNKISEWLDQSIGHYKDALQQLSLALGILIAIQLLISIQISQLVVILNRQKWAVFSLLGVKKSDKYKKFLLFLFVSYFILATPVGLFMGLHYDLKYLSSIIFIFGLFLLDMSAMLLSLQFYDKKNLSNLLKGE